jgi:hypothetical protein
LEPRKTGRRKGTVHLSGRWRSHVIECENSLRKLGAKHTGASPSRNRSELAGECVAKRQAHLGESGNSAAMPGHSPVCATFGERITESSRCELVSSEHRTQLPKRVLITYCSISTAGNKNWPETASQTKSSERRDKAGVSVGMATSPRQRP